MKLKNFTFLVFVLLSTSLILSCSEDKIPTPEEEISETEEEDPIDEEEPNDEEPNDEGPIEGELGNVEFFKSDLVEDDYILVNDAANNRVYLMDKNASLIHEWPLGSGLGNDVFLLPNGQLLALLEADDPKIKFGGFGGKLQLLDKDGNVNWNWEYSSDNHNLHHDVEMLPNGNLIVMVWEKKTTEEAQDSGYNMANDVFPEAIIEVNPNTNEIVWEWYAWDHLVQDFDGTKENFGSIDENPQLINLNYVNKDNGDIMHANGIAYDPLNDLIYLSVNFFHEVWVIDHSTTSEEAASHAGGNLNKGGDLVYRFGNPMAYNNSVGERLFHNNHFPNLLKGVATGNLLIYTNGGELEQSTVYELRLPSVMDLQPNEDNEPEIVWSFTDPDLFAPKVSGAVRLPNGNTLITEGDFGLWEVTNIGKIVWKFSGQGFFWRAYHYDKNASEILSLSQ